MRTAQLFRFQRSSRRSSPPRTTPTSRPSIKSRSIQRPLCCNVTAAVYCELLADQHVNVVSPNDPTSCAPRR